MGLLLIGGPSQWGEQFRLYGSDEKEKKKEKTQTNNAGGGEL